MKVIDSVDYGPWVQRMEEKIFKEIKKRIEIHRLTKFEKQVVTNWVRNDEFRERDNEKKKADDNRKKFIALLEIFNVKMKNLHSGDTETMNLKKQAGADLIDIRDVRRIPEIIQYLVAF